MMGFVSCGGGFLVTLSEVRPLLTEQWGFLRETALSCGQSSKSESPFACDSFW